MPLIVLTPKRTILGRNHVIWAINRENRSRGSSWACEREKNRTGQDRTGKKSQKGYISPICGEAPNWSDVHENLCNGWCSRRNHVRQVSTWNFQGLQFYRGSNFSFFLLILNGPYNSAALLRCLLWRFNVSRNFRLDISHRSGDMAFYWLLPLHCMHYTRSRIVHQEWHTMTFCFREQNLVIKSLPVNETCACLYF